MKAKLVCDDVDDEWIPKNILCNSVLWLQRIFFSVFYGSCLWVCSVLSAVSISSLIVGSAFSVVCIPDLELALKRIESDSL